MKILLGNLFDSKAKTLVNTVNCVGVMGKGIALEFKQRYPQMYSEYVSLCQEHCLRPGIPYYYEDLVGNSVLNFPTKDNWRSPSKLSYIINGLTWFRNNYSKLGITSIAFPPLGCGNGGLSWDIVGPVMYNMLSDLPIDIEIYAPYGTQTEKLTDAYLRENYHSDEEDVSGTKYDKYNDRWLLLLEVIRQVNAGKHTLHVGRVIFQKICYILTRSGVQTGFSFSRGSYGPFSADVNEARTILANRNLIIEHQIPGGKMVETWISNRFRFNESKYTQEELSGMRKTIDLFSRIKNTDQAEMIATIIFSFDKLKASKKEVSEQDIFDYVLEWKKKRYEEKQAEVKMTIQNLAILGWIQPTPSYDFEEDIF